MEMSYELLNGTVLILKPFLIFMADTSDACNMYVLTKLICVDYKASFTQALSSSSDCVFVFILMFLLSFFLPVSV